MTRKIRDRELIPDLRRRNDDIVLPDPWIDFLHDGGPHPAGIHVFHGWNKTRGTKGVGPPVLVLLDHLVVGVGTSELVEGCGGFYPNDETEDLVTMKVIRKVHRDQFYAQPPENCQRLFLRAVLG